MHHYVNIYILYAIVLNGKYILHPKNFRSECLIHRQGSDRVVFFSIDWSICDGISRDCCIVLCYSIFTVITYIYIHVCVYIYVINIHLYMLFFVARGWDHRSTTYVRMLTWNWLTWSRNDSTWNHLDYPKKVEPSPWKQAEAGNFHAQSEATDMDEIWDETWMPPWCCRKRDGQNRVNQKLTH